MAEVLRLALINGLHCSSISWAYLAQQGKGDAAACLSGK